MGSCGFGAPDPTGELQHPWGHNGDVPVNPAEGIADNPPSLGPAGTVHCNLEDWSAFIIDVLQGPKGNGVLLPIDQYEKLFEVQGDNYALGWGVYTRTWANGQVYTHTGTNTMNAAVVWIAPELDEAYLAVSNSATEETWTVLDELIVFWIGYDQ